jgi:hypothetical protein
VLALLHLAMEPVCTNSTAVGVENYYWSKTEDSLVVFAY